MVRPVLLLPILLLGLACTSPDQGEGLLVAPNPPSGKVGESITLQVEALEPLATDLTWEVREPHGGGFLRSRGFTITYVAPPMAGTYTLIAEARRTDGSRFRAMVPVTVLPDPSLEPPTVTLPPGGTRTFTARMKGLPQSTVTWSVEEPDGGDITPEGFYRAPQRRGTYHVVGTSTLDPTVSATATVHVE